MHEADVLDEGGRGLVSVVIPTLNESAFIDRTLRSIETQARPFEIVVADGGSTDDTGKQVDGRADFMVARRGRAFQLNAGAARASGDYFLFLHADTTLPRGALEFVRTAFVDPSVVGGCFRLLFDEDRLLLRFYSWGAAVLKWPKLVFGDRAIFVRRSTFEAVGGFPEQALFEDVDFFQAVSKIGRVAYLEAGVVTSARRFARYGYLIQQLRNFLMWVLYLAGVPPGRLVTYYPEANNGPRGNHTSASPSND